MVGGDAAPLHAELANAISKRLEALPGTARDGSVMAGGTSLAGTGQIVSVHPASRFFALNFFAAMLSISADTFGNGREAMRRHVCPIAPWLCQGFLRWHVDVTDCQGTGQHLRTRREWWHARTDCSSASAAAGPTDATGPSPSLQEEEREGRPSAPSGADNARLEPPPARFEECLDSLPVDLALESAATGTGALTDEPSCNSRSRPLFDRIFVMVDKAEGDAKHANLRVLPRGSMFVQDEGAWRSRLASWGIAGWRRHPPTADSSSGNTGGTLAWTARAGDGLPAVVRALLTWYADFALVSSSVREHEVRQLLASAFGCTAPMAAGDALYVAHDVPHMTQGAAAARTALVLGSCANCDAAGPSGWTEGKPERLRELEELRWRHDEAEGLRWRHDEAEGLRWRHDEAEGLGGGKRPLPEWHRIRCSSGMCVF